MVRDNAQVNAMVAGFAPRWARAGKPDDIGGEIAGVARRGIAG